ncbi:MAG TPA: hypothetical protein VLL74_04850, partial [Methanoregula sp.]|nr:hypothetical protein [Methanoregula sp.]
MSVSLILGTALTLVTGIAVALVGGLAVLDLHLELSLRGDSRHNGVALPVIALVFVLSCQLGIGLRYGF